MTDDTCACDACRGVVCPVCGHTTWSGLEDEHGAACHYCWWQEVTATWRETTARRASEVDAMNRVYGSNGAYRP